MRPYSQRHLHKDRKIKDRTGGGGGGTSYGESQ